MKECGSTPASGGWMPSLHRASHQYWKCINPSNHLDSQKQYPHLKKMADTEKIRWTAQKATKYTWLHIMHCPDLQWERLDCERMLHVPARLGCHLSSMEVQVPLLYVEEIYILDKCRRTYIACSYLSVNVTQNCIRFIINKLDLLTDEAAYLGWWLWPGKLIPAQHTIKATHKLQVPRKVPKWKSLRYIYYIYCNLVTILPKLLYQ